MKEVTEIVYGNGKVGCVVCGKTNVTLLLREGKRVCQRCYAHILTARTLKSEKKEEPNETTDL